MYIENLSVILVFILSIVLVCFIFFIFRQFKFDGKLENISQTLNNNLNNLQEKLGANLNNHSKTEEHIRNMGERLAIIDRAQSTFDSLSNRVNDLQNILSNKQLRGAFGEVQLEKLVKDLLPVNSYHFQKTLSTGNRVDCLIDLDFPPGPVCIDSKFPLEHYRSYVSSNNDDQKKKYLKEFSSSVLKHVNDISEKYIVKGETSEASIMFLPSESIFSEIHINLPDLIEKARRQKNVYIVGPNGLFFIIHSLIGLMRNVKMNDAARIIQTQVDLLLSDLDRLNDRVVKLKTHFSQAQKDLDEIQISESKISKRGEKIISMNFDEQKVPSDTIRKIDNKI